MQKLSLTKKYPTYPKYKDSGVQWVGDVPETWDATRAKNVFKRNSRPVRDEDEIITAFRDGTVTLRKNRREDGFTFAEQEIGYQGVRKGDLVIHGMDAFAGAIGVSDSDGKSSPVYAVCTPRTDADTKFHMYLLRHMSKTGYLTAIARGIRERSTEFKWNQYGNMLVVNPPKEEQEKIAQFLDEQTARIDETIAKKERMIELLKEKRTAVINQAVTKGLDPHVELIDSGVEWLGKVNSSFEIIKLRYLVKVSTGSKDTANADPAGDYPFFVRSPIIEKINSYSFDREAVLTAGDGAGVGKVFHYYNGKLDYHQRVYLFSNFRKVTGKYFYYYLSSNLARVVLMGESKSTVDSIRMTQLLKMPFTIPSKDDQDKIVGYLDEQTKKYDEILGKVKFSITKLQELKSSLISHAVTGKIKV